MLDLLKRWGIACPMVVCLFVAPAWSAAACNVSVAQTSLEQGLGRLDGDSMDLAAALSDFNAAIAQDNLCGPYFVARALVKLAQIYDTPDVKNLRAAFGDTKTFDTFVRNVFEGITAQRDSVPHGSRTYAHNESTMGASRIQGILSGPVTSILTSVLTDLISVENFPETGWQLPMPGRFIGSDTTAEIDIADVYLFHSAILAGKAAVYMLTAFNLDAGRDWREFKDADHDGLPDGDTLYKHIQDTATFFRLRGGSPSGVDSFATAFGNLRDADTLFLKFLKLTAAETNVDGQQDTELVAFKTIHKQSIWGHFDDADMNTKYANRHLDTFPAIYRGDTFVFKMKKENKDLDRVSIRLKSFFDAPLSGAIVPAASITTHGHEFNESFFADPTIGGLFPGMTNNDIFLLRGHVDTYFIVTSPNTLINLNTISNLPRKIDVKFDLSTSGPVRIRRTGGGNEWMVVVTPNASVPSHLRIFYKPAAKDFSSAEKAQLRHSLDSTMIYIVPWAVNAGLHAVDAGLTITSFPTYFNLTAGVNELFETMAFSGPSTQFDTVVPFRFGSDADPSFFKPVPSSFVSSVPGTLKTAIAVNRFGRFVLGEQVPFIKPLFGFVEGDAGLPMDDSFVIRVVNMFGQPVPGVEVTFNLPGTSDRPSGATAGSFDSNVQKTDALGKAATNYRMGDKPGVYRISVTASGLGTAYVFAFTTGYTPHPGGKWRMVSMPVYPSSSLPSAAGDTVSMCNLGLARYGPEVSVDDFIGDDFSSYKIYYWDPSKTNSATGFAGDVKHEHYVVPNVVAMGSAYWIKTAAAGVLDAVNRTTFLYSEVDEDGAPETVVLDLHAGWNMIGTPYSFSILSDDLYIDTDNDGHSLPIDSVPTTFITHQLYWIAPTNVADPTSSGYSSGPGLAHPEVGMFPFGGYWINAAQACTMVFRPIGGGAVTGEITDGGTGGAGAPPFILMGAPGLKQSTADWTVQLYVQSPAGSDYENFAGVRPTTAAAASFYEPPVTPGGVGLAFVDGGKKYSQNLKPSGEDPTWAVEVYSSAAGPVTIHPSNVSSVPANLPVTMRDETTGDVVNLRASSYTYTSNADETRKFTFAASELEPGTGWFTKVVQPAMCVIGRNLTHPAWLEGLRSVRDSILSSSIGRRWVHLYYLSFSF